VTPFSFCDELGAEGFGWIADEAMTRASHALAQDGRVWFVDALDWEPAIERAGQLGEPAGVIQLLDRHDRDCAALAERLAVPHLVVPDEIPDSPFEVVSVMRRKRWQERALWWTAARTLVTADALGTNAFYTGGKRPVGVHVFLRLKPPNALARYDAERLLVGHGQGVATAAASAVREAMRTSRRDLPRILVRLPFSAR
jgi:hypothetical protein